MSENTGIMSTEDIEIQLILDAMALKYGYDFREYSRAHMKRRIKNRQIMGGFESISAMQHEILTNKTFFDKILPDFSINVTEMFRDPEVFAFIRKEVVPLLKTYPQLKIWHAGCSSGQEVYSLAILLKEEGLYDRCQIYATDFNDKILQKAKYGIYPIDVVKQYTKNYIAADGKESFSDYYIAKYESIIMDQSLKKNIIFAQHNLVTDQVFGQMHFIICRNVLIYFNNVLQSRVLDLFRASLRSGGMLCLGTKETLKEESVNAFDVYNKEFRLYRKKMVR
ncbi:CheR family methyltransferase [Fusibacter sp. JL216-2]|uniref:CheR family methyltransferase n=1 Tax=Fusibacter sp. JL216-2 TaxID=3071453 RepID=UPI003D32D8E7